MFKHLMINRLEGTIIKRSELEKSQCGNKVTQV